ncbi:DUF4365 domain-containing protein [Rhodococcus sp. ABRD24]|uniref:DUF4365 domain-containing protein n=1 Tax=Rhodococcus sp. ABRD24 TaxID=2507582 RepID=UPI0013F162A3|nr:DUF4365 domain-containing protein [Rhodococcus sp. ABRD24]
MSQLKMLLTACGVPIEYEQDRAAIDTGLHLFVEGANADYSASQTRVWFQAKGKRAQTLSAEQFRSASSVSTPVEVDHLRYWYAAPEPVYLVVFVESTEVFIAEDVRAIVDRAWPDGDFYKATEKQTTVTVHLSKAAVLDERRIKAMLDHRSMRIDGPAFQGRPLGHRFDPLRSELAIDTRELWTRIVERLLSEHRFRETAPRRPITSDITLMNGCFFDTMVWQSSAFAEFGRGSNDGFRDDPAVESVHGQVVMVLDSEPNRAGLSSVERMKLLSELTKSKAPVVLFFFGKDLSGTGGVWRQFLREEVQLKRPRELRMLGTEALTSLVLAATLVYLDLAPDLSFKTVNYRY